MKTKIVLLLVSVIFFFTGCITFQVKDDEALIGVTEIIARRIALKVSNNESEKISYIKEKCDEILATDINDSGPLLETALRYAVTNYTGDKLLYDDILSLCKLFGIDLKSPDMDFDMGELRTLRAGLLAFRKVLN